MALNELLDNAVKDSRVTVDFSPRHPEKGDAIHIMLFEPDSILLELINTG